MTSQTSIQSSFGGSLTLPLSKFSHATVSEDTGTPIPWVHLANRGDLFAVFEDGPSMVSSQGPPDQKLFRVVNGADLMEELNLAALAAEARKAKAQFSDSGIAGRVNAVTIIIKAPCIAVRYPKGLRQIQRFQMRFASNTDYYTALGRFSAVDAPLTEAGSILPPPRPISVSSSSSLLRPSDSVSNVGAQPPLTLIDSRHQVRGTSSGYMAQSEVSIAAHRIVPSDVHRTGTSLDQPASAVSYTIPFKSPAKMRNSSPPVVSMRSGTSLTEPFNISKYTDGGTITSIGPTNGFEGRTTTLPASKVLKTPTVSHVITALSDYHPRPSTAPAVESQSLRDMLPPRRVLPFPKSSSEAGPKTLSKQESTAKPIVQSATIIGATSIPGTSSFQGKVANSQELETQSAPSSNPKVKKATAKKPAARAARKPAAPKSKKSTTRTGQSPVPSVEDLLSRSRESGKEVATIATEIDTQSLLALVEEEHAFRAISSIPQKRNLPADFCQLDGWVPPSAQRPGPQTFQSPADRTPEESSQVQQTEHFCIEAPIATTRSSLEHRDLCRSSSENLTVPVTDTGRDPTRVATPPVQPQLQFPLQETGRLGTKSINKRATPGSSMLPSLTAMRLPLTKRPSNAPTNSTLSAPGMSASQPTSQYTVSLSKLIGPLEALLQDENFAPSPDLGQWARQSEEDRRANLETFICNNIDSPDFLTLCKDLSEMWQSKFLAKKI